MAQGVVLEAIGERKGRHPAGRCPRDPKKTILTCTASLCLVLFLSGFLCPAGTSIPPTQRVAVVAELRTRLRSPAQRIPEQPPAAELGHYSDPLGRRYGRPRRTMKPRQKQHETEKSSTGKDSLFGHPRTTARRVCSLPFSYGIKDYALSQNVCTEPLRTLGCFRQSRLLRPPTPHTLEVL